MRLGRAEDAVGRQRDPQLDPERRCAVVGCPVVGSDLVQPPGFWAKEALCQEHGRAWDVERKRADAEAFEKFKAESMRKRQP